MVLGDWAISGWRWSPEDLILGHKQFPFKAGRLRRVPFEAVPLRRVLVVARANRRKKKNVYLLVDTGRRVAAMYVADAKKLGNLGLAMVSRR